MSGEQCEKKNHKLVINCKYRIGFSKCIKQSPWNSSEKEVRFTAQKPRKLKQIFYKNQNSQFLPFFFSDKNVSTKTV